jgi:acyl carrier protein
MERKTMRFLLGCCLVWIGLIASSAEAANCRPKMVEIVAKRLGVAKSKVVPEAKIVADLRGDDLVMVELVFELEEAFNIEIGDDAMERVVKVGDLFRVVEAKAAACR